MKDPKQSKSSDRAKTEPAAPSRHPQPRGLTRAEGKSSRRADALFKTLSTDYLLREQFVTDPAQIMSEYLFGERLADDVSDAANQLIYAVMSNPRLRDWMAEYSRALRGATPDRHTFALQFARAVGTRGDALTTLALIRGAAEGREHFVVQADLLRAILVIIGRRIGASGTEMSPGGGTEVSPGGTEMSPGGIFAGTEMSPGGGTEMSPGGGTEMSPGAIFAGTEMSPGGGTEMSPGAFTGRGHLLIALTELVRYATQLRARGALLSSGLEGR